jgi:hypothetical protein
VTQAFARAILEDAALATIDFVVASAPQAEDVDAFCSSGGEVVAASEADVAGLVRSAQPVFDMMEADPQTAAFIDQIRELKDGPPAPEAPTSCDPS